MLTVGFRLHCECPRGHELSAPIVVQALLARMAGQTKAILCESCGSVLSIYGGGSSAETESVAPAPCACSEACNRRFEQIANDTTASLARLEERVHNVEEENRWLREMAGFEQRGTL